MEDATPHFFRTPADLRAWFEANHDKVDVMWVGYYKKATKLPSVTVPESVDLALCYGWIDGLKRSVDDKAYKIRFTPRRKRSRWSARNLARMELLLAQGVVAEPGLAAYRRRDPGKDEQPGARDAVVMPAAYERLIKARPGAWAYFRNATPSYRKHVTRWVVGAKREETRLRRLGILIESCAAGKVIPPMRWMEKQKG